uniref:Histidine kinase n=1 Tax=Tolypothrix bouteillei VB521301 TaxID=1479485 RepID=A0A0C1QWJ1_9CYAN
MANKFNFLLILVFLGSIIVGGVIFSNILTQKAQNEVTAQANILLQTMNSVRNYTTDEIIPLFENKLQNSTEFIPQTVASFSAREVFDNVRKNDNYQDFVYKEAALDPTNIRDKADDFETQIINQFSNNASDTGQSGFRNLPSGKAFYIARRLTLDNPTCLQCHSTPDKAPKSQLAIYGDKHGFGWELDKTLFAQMIYVPADKIFQRANRSWWLVMTIEISIFAIIIIVINLLLRRAVIKPIMRISKLAQAVSTGKASSDFEQKSNDEIGVLAASFNRMKSSLEIAMRLISQKNH